MTAAPTAVATGRAADSNARTPGVLRSGTATPAPDAPPPNRQATATEEATGPATDSPAGPVTITIFYTNDEHG